MPSKTKPTKRERRLGVRAIAKLDKYVGRRPYPPGVHGSKRARQMSDFGLHLQEKQRVKFIYGLRERQLVRLFALDSKNFLSTLERRLDNCLFRSGLTQSRAQARQFINHGHIRVNNKKVTAPSYLVAAKDIISPQNPDIIKLAAAETPDWLSLDKKNKRILIKKLPTRDEITSEINDQLIIEYYSR